MRSSIQSFQVKKKIVIDRLMDNDIYNEKKDVEVKENELMFWKNQYERKILENS